MTPQEEQLFNKARMKIEEQQELLKRLTAKAYHIATVTAVFKDRFVVDTGNQLLELERADTSLDVQVGQTVELHPETAQIVRVSEYSGYGATGKVAAIDGDIVQVNTPSGLVTTPYTTVPGLSVGDKVVLNSTNRVVMHRLPEQTQYAFKTQRVLDWADVGAQDEAKRELIAAIETPYAQQALYGFFRKPRVKGCLLWGRPGNGKTLLGRCAAGALARLHGKQAQDSGFVYIKGPEVLDKYVGESESRIQEAFAFGRAHFKKHGYPCVIFLDEADAILIRRGMRTAGGMEQTIVPMFNAEMDGIEDSGTLVILATNRAEIIDPAIVRPGRIDRSIYVAPPTKENAPEIFGIHMRDVPVAKGSSKEQLIASAVDDLYSDKYPLYLIETEKGKTVFGLGGLASGAVIAGIVERASAAAIDRVIASHVTEGMTVEEIEKMAGAEAGCLGLTQPDFDAAMAAYQKSQQGMNHFDELREFVENGKLEVKSIEVCHTGQKMEKQEPPRKEEEPRQVMVVNIPESKHGLN